MSRIAIPDPSLVVLVGPAGAGKSTFAARHFAQDEVLSSDAVRASIAGSAADQAVTRTAFAILHRQLVTRLAAGRLTVVDATNLERPARRALLARARAASLPAVAIVLALPAPVVHARNAGRVGRVVPEDVVSRHLDRLAYASAEGGDRLRAEGFDAVHVVMTAADLDGLVVTRAGRPARSR